jgi:very-short-patch-repair endonuclease
MHARLRYRNLRRDLHLTRSKPGRTIYIGIRHKLEDIGWNVVWLWEHEIHADLARVVSIIDTKLKRASQRFKKS